MNPLRDIFHQTFQSLNLKPGMEEALFVLLAAFIAVIISAVGLAVLDSLVTKIEDYFRNRKSNGSKHQNIV
jgi:hypothetical protein